LQLILQLAIDFGIPSAPAAHIESVSVADRTARAYNAVLRLRDLNVGGLSVELQEQKSRHQSRCDEHDPQRDQASTQ
jgi:hypothetical protein